MKTAEQMTADVLARRDAFLKERAVRRNKAKRYTAASLLVCAAAFAAAGLFRSGLLDDTPPVSLEPVTQSSRPTDAPGNGPGLSGNGTGTDEPTTVPHAVNTTETTTVIDLSGKPGYVFPSVTQAPPTAPREEPGTAPTRAPEQETTTRRQPPETTAAPTDPATEAPPPPSRPDLPTDSEKACAGLPTAAPAEEPETEDPTATQPEEPCDNVLYVAYDGALYAAEDVPPASIPAGARTLEQKDALLYGDTLLDAALAELTSPGSGGVAGSAPAQPNGTPSAWLGVPDIPEESEPVSMRITLLALPGASADARIGVTSEGFDGKMFVLEYCGMLEELIQEETP